MENRFDNCIMLIGLLLLGILSLTSCERNTKEDDTLQNSANTQSVDLSRELQRAKEVLFFDSNFDAHIPPSPKRRNYWNRFGPFLIHPQENYQPISKEEAHSIFKNLVGFEPLYCSTAQIYNKNCIVCMANKTGPYREDKMFYAEADVFSYILTNNYDYKWRLETQNRIFYEGEHYTVFQDGFEMKSFDNKPFIYFLYRRACHGNASDHSDLQFTLYSLIDSQLTVLEYGGYPMYSRDGKDNYRGIKGTFTEIKDKDEKPKLYKFLKSKASMSKTIFRPTKEDLDMTRAENYKEKWALDNPNAEEGWRQKGVSFPLNVVYYDESIFPTEEGSIISKAENSKFKVISLFRDDVLAYDKIRKKYFAIWVNVERCMRGCDKVVSFTNKTTLQIVYDERLDSNMRIIVNLANMTYTKVYEKSQTRTRY